MAFFGRYIEVTPHSRLVWTNDDSDAGAVTTLAVGRLALHDAEENPDAVLAALDDKTEAVIASSKPGTRRRAVDGIVPEGHLRSRRPTHRPALSAQRQRAES